MFGYDSDSQREAQDWFDQRTDPTEKPPAWVVKAFEDSDGFPYTADKFRVLDAAWAEGRPRHGEKRSDDHTSRYRTKAPLSQFPADYPDECPECRGRGGIYDYETYHNIAGSESLVCDNCGRDLHSRSWG